MSGRLASDVFRGHDISVRLHRPPLHQTSNLENGQAKKSLPWPVAIFLVGLVIPWVIPVGSMDLSAYRVVLLLSVLPCCLLWARGKAGRIRVPDIGLLLFSAWAAITFVVAHGASLAIQPAGMLFIETVGAYMLARCYVRNAEDFRNMLLLAVRIVLVLSPFGLYEWVTGNKPILSTFGLVFPTVEVTRLFRMGFWRVQGPFNHSIEFGLFCSSTIAMTHLVLGRERSAFPRWFLTGSVSGMTILSMSSAPFGAMAMQAGLLTWNWALRQYKSRWKLLWGIVFTGYLIIEFGSNQTPFQFYIAHFTFDQQSGWWRIWIWEAGSASVMNHPLFGIGFGDWVRPAFMISDSVDNFWLLTAMRHGIPAIILMLGSTLWMAFSIARKKGLDAQVEAYRTAYLICISAFIFVGCTIHFSGPIYVWFLFLLGSGAWLLDINPASTEQSGEVTTRRRLNVRTIRTAPRIGERKASRQKPEPADLL